MEDIPPPSDPIARIDNHRDQDSVHQGTDRSIPRPLRRQQAASSSSSSAHPQLALAPDPSASQSSSSSSFLGGINPPLPPVQAIATRTRGALRASLGGNEAAETASSASAGSRQLDTTAAITADTASGNHRVTRSTAKKRRLSESSPSSTSRRRTGAGIPSSDRVPSASTSKGKQKATQPITDEDEPQSFTEDAPARKRARRASAAVAEPESSSFGRRKMSGKGKTRGGAPKKQPKPSKRERNVSGSGMSRRNRSNDDDLGAYEDEDVDMDDYEPPLNPRRKMSSRRAAHQAGGTGAGGGASSSGLNADVDSDEHGESDEDGEEEDDCMDAEEQRPNAGSAPATAASGAGAASRLSEGAAAFLASVGRGPGGAGGPAAASAAAALLDAASGPGGVLGGLYGFGGGGGARFATKWREMINNLKSPDPSVRLAALEQTSMELAMAMEEMLAGRFPTESAVKEFVAILKGEPNIEKLTDGGEVREFAPPEDDDGFGEDAELRAALALSRGGMSGSLGGGMDDEGDIQAQLLACRCIANLMEVLQGSTAVIVQQGAIPVLCSKLENIAFIELGEQVISTLEKIATEQPSSIVRAGGMEAMLQYVDFFSSYTQRSAVAAVSSCCRRVSTDNFEHVKAVFPTIRGLLGYPDEKLVEHAAQALIRALDSFKHRSDLLEQLLDKETVLALNVLLMPSGGSQTLPPAIYTDLLKALSSSAKASVQVTLAFIDAEIPGSMYYILTGVLPPAVTEITGGVAASPPSETVVLQNIGHRPKDQVEEALVLLSELLPPLPKDGVFEPRNYSERMLGKYVKAKSKIERERSKNPGGPVLSLEDIVQASSSSHAPTSTAATPSTAPTPGSETAIAEALGISVAQVLSISKAKKDAEQATSAKAEVFQQNIESVNRLIQIVLPVLVSVYTAAPAMRIRAKVLFGLLRAISFSSADLLRSSLKMVPLASLLSTIISSKESDAITLGMLQMVELLLDKVPDVYMRSFHREGIFQEVCNLAQEELSASALQRSIPASEKKAAATKVEDAPEAGDSHTATTGPAPTELASAAVPSTSAPADPAGSEEPDRKPEPSTLLAIDKAGATAAARKQSSVPTNPHDVNIVRCRILRLRKGLDVIDEEITGDSGSIRGIKALLDALADKKASREALGITLDSIASMFIEGEEPLSSYEVLSTGLLDSLMDFLSEDDHTLPASDRRRMLYHHFATPRQGRSETAFGELVKRLQESLSKSEMFEVQLAATSPRDVSRNHGPLDNLVRQLKIHLIADDEVDLPKPYRDVYVAVAAITPLSAVHSYLRQKAMSGSAPPSRGGLTSMYAAYAAGLLGSEALRDRVAGSRGGGLASAAEGDRPSTAPAGADAAAAPAADAGGPSTTGSLLATRRSSARLRGEQPAAEAGVKAEEDAAQADPAEHAEDGIVADKDSDSEEAEPEAEPGHEEEGFPGRLIIGEDGEEDDYGEDMDDDEGMYDDDMMDDDVMDRPAEKTVELSMPEDGKAEATTPQGTRVATPTGNVSAAEASKTSDLPPRMGGSYASAVRAPPQDWHYKFTINEQEVLNGETVFGAVTRTLPENRPKPSIWEMQPIVRYKKVKGPAPVPTVSEIEAEDLEPGSASALPESLAKNSSTAKVLRVLHVLHALNEDIEDSRAAEAHPALDAGAFINTKMTAKFTRQLEELVVVASDCLPDWALDLPTFFPFLFPFEARYIFLQSTSFGYSRLISKWMAVSPPVDQRRSDMLSSLPRPQRCRVRIARNNILQSAVRVMELYGPSAGILEIEYFDEPGTGLGPTLEFYSLVSKAMASKALDLWRDDDAAGDGEHVRHPRGLFPRPLAEETALQTLDSETSLFKVMGIFAGKGLLDSRILDLNFNKVFMRAVLGHPVELTTETLALVDPSLAKTLRKLEDYVEAKRSQGLGSTEDVMMDGATIEDLSLDFTAPGFPDVLLKTNGDQIEVTSENVEEYIALVLDLTLSKGIARQVEAFKDGFSKIFPVAKLSVFSPSELVLLFGDPDEDWSKETLEQAIKADHGYNSDSKQVKDLIETMTEFTMEERRAFLQFATGAPKLPIGGFKGLSPQFTVVRKPHEPPYQADHYLPSVMTCAQYLKLPSYSSKAVLKAQVLKATAEGAGGFLLS